jgi:ribosome biogenesis GTPase
MSRPGHSDRGGSRGRKIRVDFRRNRQRPPRQKTLPAHLAEQADDHDELASPTWETVAAKGDLSRKRTVIEREHPASSGSLEGIVAAVRGLIADVEATDGRRYSCTVRRVLRTLRIGERHPVVVGDRVRFRPAPVRGDSAPEGMIESVMPRRTRLCRATEREAHLIAANVDQVLVVASADQPPLKTSLIDRYLVSASAGMMAAVVCVNKIDLDETGYAAEVLERYRRIGYPVLATSTVSGSGIDELRQILAGKSSVLAGQSGVGKSSLLNAVQPGLKLRVGDVCKETAKGRHTTTTAQLLKLETGGYVVDTPGVRAFELAMIPVSELEAHFIEFEKYVAGCKFHNCTHIHEIGCAVLAAVERGEIHPARHASYVRLFKERSGLAPLGEDEEVDHQRR